MIMLFILVSCSGQKDTFWCGDHPCINKKEKEAYFKKTMIVEIKDLKNNTTKNNSEIEKIILQAKKKEKERIKEQKYIDKQSKQEAKRLKKEKKKLAKEAKLEAKRIEKEEKKLDNQIEKDEAVLNKKKKKGKPKQTVNFDTDDVSLSTFSSNFNKLVEKITKRNNSRPYPDINDIQD